jgi:LmbE family N-acetylglucosaminyl deacetylase
LARSITERARSALFQKSGALLSRSSAATVASRFAASKIPPHLVEPHLHLVNPHLYIFNHDVLAPWFLVAVSGWCGVLSTLSGTESSLKMSRRDQITVIGDQLDTPPELCEFPAMNFPATFISIGAHCDDVEGRTGGTFARLVRQGARGVYVVVVENAFTAPGVVMDTVTALATRRQEARDGAALLGASRVEFFEFKSYYLSTPDRRQVMPAFRDRADVEAMASDIHWHGLPPVQNAYLFPECVQRLRQLIEDEQPSLILTHSPNDRHPDHYAVSRFTDLVVGDLNAEGAGLSLWFRQPGGAGSMGGWRPTVLVELSEEDLEIKRRSLESFPSQHPAGMGRFAHDLARRCGRLGGVQYAEAFCDGGGAPRGAWDTDPGLAAEVSLASTPLRVVRLSGEVETVTDAGLPRAPAGLPIPRILMSRRTGPPLHPAAVPA